MTSRAVRGKGGIDQIAGYEIRINQYRHFLRDLNCCITNIYHLTEYRKMSLQKQHPKQSYTSPLRQIQDNYSFQAKGVRRVHSKFQG